MNDTLTTTEDFTEEIAGGEINVLPFIPSIHDMYMKFNENTFRAWIESKEDDAIIGIGGDPASCPIANCITDMFGLQNVPVLVLVDINNIEFRSLDTEYSFECWDYVGANPWGVFFVNAADAHTDRGEAILKKDALELLQTSLIQVS